MTKSLFNTGTYRSLVLGLLLLSLLNTLADNLDEWTLQNSRPYIFGVAANSNCLVAVAEKGAILYSTNAENWLSVEAPANPLWGDTTTYFWNIASGNGLFVAAGYQFVPGTADGIILTSSNGLQWSLIRFATNALYGINYVNGQFLAVGKQGLILASIDGINWQSRFTGITNNLFSVAYGNGVYVAVGWYLNSSILTSVDGTNWTSQTPPGGGWAESVAYGQGRFVVTKRQPYFWTSTDGTNWSESPLPGNASLNSITFGHDVFVAGGTGFVGTSTDGSNWVQRPLVNTYDPWRGSALWSDTFVVVGQNGIIQSQPFSGPKRPPRLLADPQSRIALNNTTVSLSVTGAAWPPLGFQWRLNDQSIVGKTNSSLSIVANATNAGHYTLVATNSTGSVTSAPALLTVVNRITPIQPATMPITLGETFTLGVTSSSNSTLAFQWRTNKSNITGETNSTLTISNALLTQPSYDIIVTNSAGAVTNPAIYVTVEPYHQHPLYRWTDRSPSDLASALSWPINGAQGSLSGVTYGNGIFVAVGVIAASDYGAILSSEDGAKWVRHQPPAGQQYGLPLCLYDVAFGNETFVAVGFSSSIYSSTNGTNWTLRMLGNYGTSLNRVVFRSGYFWTTGNQTLRSTNGITWQSWPSWPGYSDLPLSAAGVYATVSNSPSGLYGLYISTNASNWALAHASDRSLTDVTFGNGTFVAVGDNGTIIQSDPVAQIAWPTSSPRHLAVRGLVGRQYQVDYRDSLVPLETWSPLSTFVLTTNPVLVPVDPSTSSTNRFFRSALLP